MTSIPPCLPATPSGRARGPGLALLAVLVALAACAPSQPTRYYTLDAVEAGAAWDAAGTAAAQPVPGPVPGPVPVPGPAPGPAVGIEAVTLPAYLDRPQIVLRSGPTTVEVADLDVWIEPLDRLVPRILAENLARLLGTDRVLQLPQRRPPELDYRVELDLFRLDAAPPGQAILDGRWRVTAADSGRIVAERRVRLTEPVADMSDRATVAAALSRALGAVSRDIAGAIRPLAAAAGAGTPR